MPKKVDAGFDPNDIQQFEEKLDELFSEIDRKLKQQNLFSQEVAKVKQGLRDNREMTIKNEVHYATMKTDLKNRALITHDTPLSVTGQLIDDFEANLSRHTELSKEYTYYLTFSNDPRLRPTYKSMVRVYRGLDAALQTFPSSSKDIVRELQMYKGYPIIETIKKVYTQDFINKIENTIAEAFKQVD